MKAEDVARELEWTGGLMPPRWKTAEAKAIRAVIEERDALRTLLATARAHLLGCEYGYENEVIVAIDAALKETKL